MVGFTLILGAVDLLAMLLAVHWVGAAAGGAGGVASVPGGATSSFFHMVLGWRQAAVSLTQLTNGLPGPG